ncbi:MAG: DJ-1/PfpI family protein [Gammaproteobacteria bacterium]|nr:DJ-1/PfpI family protein [Gammaproteobacteria bacterium]
MASVLVPLAQGCEELEAITIVDLLRRASINVVTAGLGKGPVKASRGTVIIPDKHIDEVLNDDFDMIVLPGGLPGSDYLDNDTRIRKLLVNTAEQGKYIAAICAAPKVLASTGLLENKNATGYPGVLDKMEVEGLKLQSSPVVKDGKIITSRGPGTAMDFTLTLIEELSGKAKRDEVEAGLVR